MNKIIKLLLVCIAFCGVSCSSDSETETESTFKFAVNGEDFTQEGFYAGNITKTEDTFSININTNYGDVVVSFNESGQFGFLNIDRHTGTPHITSRFYSSYFNTSDNLSFELTSINEESKRVKGTFSGYIYADPLNVNSEKKYVEGEFNVMYQDRIPQIFGLTNKCKINGNDWVRSNKYFESNPGSGFANVAQHYFNCGQYEIIVRYNSIDVAVGTYNYTGSNLTNKVDLVKYDSATGIRTVYNSSGNLTITKKNGGIIYGNYSFTAVNPNNTGDVIQVSDGTVKFNYNN